MQDTLTAIRHGVTVAEAGERLQPNAERHLRTRVANSAVCFALGITKVDPARMSAYSGPS